MRSLLSMSTALLLLLVAAPAHAAVDLRWPWEPPAPAREEDRRDDRDHRRDDRRGPRNPAPESRANHGPDAEFVERMLSNTAQQLELAALAAKRGHDPDVRAMARRTLDEAGALEQTLLARARELGLSSQPRAAHISLPHGGWELDLAYLRATLDTIAYERPYFADVKSSVGGSFHDALQGHWNAMVYRRDDVKRLHDDVRNAARRHGADV